MRRILVIALLAFAVAPVAASVAAGGPNAASNASASCTALKAKMGATTFAQAYTSFGACVSALTSVEQQNIASAEAQCTGEQNDAGFAAAHGNKTFAQFYGTGKNGKDAFNKCVSAKTKASSKAEQLARTNPSRTCNTLRTRLGASTFTLAYGNARHEVVLDRRPVPAAAPVVIADGRCDVRRLAPREVRGARIEQRSDPLPRHQEGHVFEERQLRDDPAVDAAERLLEPARDVQRRSPA